MILVDAHCDSLEKASQTQSSLISPYNFSKNHRQLQFAAIFCGVEGESPKDSYLRAQRLLGQYTLSLSSEGLLPVRQFFGIRRISTLRPERASSFPWKVPPDFWAILQFLKNSITPV